MSQGLGRKGQGRVPISCAPSSPACEDVLAGIDFLFVCLLPPETAILPIAPRPQLREHISTHGVPEGVSNRAHSRLESFTDGFMGVTRREALLWLVRAIHSDAESFSNARELNDGGFVIGAGMLAVVVPPTLCSRACWPAACRHAPHSRAGPQNGRKT
jgi:hypothetical protein